jgi:membrane protease YdiL (CAAX protease family)
VSEPDQIVSAPPGARPVRWGMGDAAAGWVAAQVCGAITVSLVLMISGDDDTDSVSLGWLAVGQLGLWLGFTGAAWWAARVKGNGLVRDFGVRGRPWDSVFGLGVGVATQLVVLPLLYLPIFVLFDKDSNDVEEVARNLTDRATDPVGVVLLVLIVGICAPLAEELFYRGLVFRSIENRLGTRPGIVLSGLVFGASHFQLLQLPGLAVFGMILAYLTHRTGRLAPAIFAHVAFNMLTVVFLVAD